MNQKQTEQKKQNSETVIVTLKVPVTKKFYKVLQALSELTGLSIENMLTDDLFEILTSYFSGEYFKAWVEYAVDQMAQQKNLENLETEPIEKSLEKLRENLY